MKRRRSVSQALTVLALLALLPPAGLAQAPTDVGRLVSELRFRSIGPAVTGGRIHDVEALPDDPATVYVATASGGIWKSVNAGTTWEPIFDDQPVSTFGDLAIARSNPDILYAGTGEQNNRQSTSWGNGVYRSDDGGRSWRHLGLEGTRHVGRVLIRPLDPRVVYVAALGNLWAPSRDRGVYRTTDGGESWDQVLFVDTLTGVVDMVMDPADPDVIYAAAYQRLRRTWGFNGGGPGSGIYKTTDGGDTWRELTDGLPAGDKGRIGLAISAGDPAVLVAIVEHAEESGIYRSADAGESWERVNRLNPRPMYYSHIFIDPTNEDRIYVLATSFYRSENGGRDFETMPTRPTYDVGVHSDFHTLWIDPNDPDHFYLAGDAGLHETHDRGATFTRINNFPIGQFYAIGVDSRDPYYIYGGMQDNHSWMAPNRTRHWIGIINDDWWQIGFGDGMYHAPDPVNHRYVYSVAQNGDLDRVDPETGDRLGIRPYPPDGEPDYRFDWVTPVIVSRHDPRVVYLGGNRLFISRDRGRSWERTPDLSRGLDRDTLRLMGVAGSDIALSRNDGTESFGEIVTIAESPLDRRVLWVGTDDGNLQVSRDGGASWTEVSGNVAGVADGTYVSRVIASVRGTPVAYATFDAHRDGDFRPYVFRTEDFGRSWEPLSAGLPEEGSVNVILEHPDNPNLLFLGSEHSLFLSLDAGASWTRWSANLPTTLYDDLALQTRENDLIVATHGRSLWILDDVTPLVQWSAEAAESPALLFAPRPATIFQYRKDTSYRGQGAYAGTNPPDGALISYYLSEGAGAGAGEVSLVVADEGGGVIRRLTGPGEAGIIHRINWDLRHEPPPFEPDTSEGRALPQLPRPIEPRGPFVTPGAYTVTLRADGAVSSQTLVVRPDPLLELDPAEWGEREAFLLEVLDLQRRAWDADRRARELRDALRAERDSLEAGGGAPAGLQARADSVAELSGRLRRLRSQVYGLAGEFNGGGVRQGSLLPPTRTHRERKSGLERRLGEELAALRSAAGDR